MQPEYLSTREPSNTISSKSEDSQGLLFVHSISIAHNLVLPSIQRCLSFVPNIYLRRPSFSFIFTPARNPLERFLSFSLPLELPKPAVSDNMRSITFVFFQSLNSPSLTIAPTLISWSTAFRCILSLPPALSWEDLLLHLPLAKTFSASQNLSPPGPLPKGLFGYKVETYV